MKQLPLNLTAAELSRRFGAPDVDALGRLVFHDEAGDRDLVLPTDTRGVVAVNNEQLHRLASTAFESGGTVAVRPLRSASTLRRASFEDVEVGDYVYSCRTDDVGEHSWGFGVVREVDDDVAYSSFHRPVAWRGAPCVIQETE